MPVAPVRERGGSTPALNPPRDPATMRQGDGTSSALVHPGPVRLRDTLDTRITCSVEWVSALCREIQGDPSGAPSQTAKNAEQRTIARGDGDSTHSRGEGIMSCPKGPSSLATQLCLPVETKTVPSSACCPGCSCISSSRAESCPLNHARSTRDGTVTRAFTESVNRRMWGPIIDSKRNANAVLGPPDLPHTHSLNPKDTTVVRTIYTRPPSPLPALAL